jgi:tripartite-type tricarboxylate transporter receptor subunit TctC
LKNCRSGRRFAIVRIPVRHCRAAEKAHNEDHFRHRQPRKVSMRKSILSAALPGALSFLMLAAPARADDYPNKLITIVVPSTPGGVSDTLARAVAQHLTKAWGQQVIAENKPGANNGIAAEYVAKAPPDGYTLLLGPDTTFTVNPFVYKKLPYDADRDFAPVAGLVSLTHALITKASAPVQTVKDLLDLARKQPGQLNYGTFGIGSIAHVNMEMLQDMAGVKFTPVHYRGATPAMTDVVAGHIDMMFLSVGSAVQPWRAGQVKMLAVSSAKRVAQLSEMPTIAESGVPGFEGKTWFGLFAPAGTPKDIIARLNVEVAHMFESPEFRDRIMLPQFFEPISGSPEEFGRFVAAEEKKWSAVLQAAHIRLE